MLIIIIAIIKINIRQGDVAMCPGIDVVQCGQIIIQNGDRTDAVMEWQGDGIASTLILIQAACVSIEAVTISIPCISSEENLQKSLIIDSCRSRN